MVTCQEKSSYRYNIKKHVGDLCVKDMARLAHLLGEPLNSKQGFLNEAWLSAHSQAFRRLHHLIGLNVNFYENLPRS
jgi:hypothetical protein